MLKTLNRNRKTKVIVGWLNVNRRLQELNPVFPKNGGSLLAK